MKAGKLEQEKNAKCKEWGIHKRGSLYFFDLNLLIVQIVVAIACNALSTILQVLIYNNGAGYWGNPLTIHYL